VLFTGFIIVPISLLNQSDGRTLYLLAVFAVYWITMSTFTIVFTPKVIAIYKDASGLLAQRISDSKASASDIASRNATMGRGIKDLAQQPIRLMDRTTLRTYVNLLEKELTMARAALATLDANEGVLAAGTGHAYKAMPGQGGPQIGGVHLSQQGGNLSGPNSRVDSGMPAGRSVTPHASMGSSGFTVGGSTVASAGRPYATGNMSPKSSAAAAASSQLPGMIRTGSQITKFGSTGVATTAGGASHSMLLAAAALATANVKSQGPSVPVVRSIAQVAPQPIVSSPTLGVSSASTRAPSPAVGGMIARSMEMKGLTGHSSAAAAAAAAASGGTDDFSLAPSTTTRFRMPVGSNAGLGLGFSGTSQGAPLSPIPPSPLPPPALTIASPPTSSSGRPTAAITPGAASGGGSGGGDRVATPGSTSSGDPLLGTRD
jgi:hypothetical protein